MTVDNIPCSCLEMPDNIPAVPLQHVRRIGVDVTNGRYGDVELLQCQQCNRYWLHYFVEYEAFTASGRWFMGVITPEQAQGLTPDKAIPLLESLDWHLWGGSYFYGKKGKSTNWKTPCWHLPVDG